MTVPMSSVTIKFLTRNPLTIDYDPEEKIWLFCRRVALENPTYSFDNGSTLDLRLLYDGKIINSFEKRLKPVGSLVTDSSKDIIATSATLSRHGVFRFKGNARECSLGDRETCVICLDDLNADNPKFDQLAPLILNCNHCFHHGCIRESILKLGSTCPTCKVPIEEYLSDTLITKGCNWV